MARTRVVVVGTGLVGSFTAMALAERGADVVALEAFESGHVRGSSHGGSRIFRHAYEQPEYVQLARLADEGWTSLERDTGERLRWRAGGLDFASRSSDALSNIEAALAGAGSSYERLSADEVARRFPAFQPEAHVEALFQPDAAVVAADRAVLAATRRAVDLGATVSFETPVERIESIGDDTVVVTTARGERLEADAVVVSAGPWFTEGPLALDLPLVVERQQVVYASVPSGAAYGADAMPIFIDRDVDCYGMGRLEHPSAIKVSDHSGAPKIRLSERTFDVDRETARRTLDRVRRLIPGTGAMVSSTTCLYTKTPDEDFVLDRHPSVPGVWIAAGFSGHGFKFGPALGRGLAACALDGGSPAFGARFRLDRFATSPSQPSTVR